MKNKMERKFNFDDVVIIRTDKKKYKKYNERKGVVTAMPPGEYYIGFSYLVELLNKAGTDENFGKYGSVDIPETELVGTNEKIDSNKMMTDNFIRVSVDPNTGEGKVIGTYKKKKKPGVMWN